MRYTNGKGVVAMNSRLRVYIETTIFNWCFEVGREYSIESKRLFEKIAAGEVTAFTSTAAMKELKQAPEPKWSQMLKLITTHNIKVWEMEQEAEALADLYIAAGIIPARFWLDGVHIAMAATNDADCIISLNFKLPAEIAPFASHTLFGAWHVIQSSCDHTNRRFYSWED